MGEQGEQRKRMISSETGVSPEAKRQYMSDSPEPKSALKVLMEEIMMPPDDAPASEWSKACFLKMDQMCKLFTDLKESIDFHEKDVSKNTKELLAVKETMLVLEQRVGSLEMKTQELEIQNRHLKEENLVSEIRRREYNIIFEGIPDTYREESGYLYMKFVDVLNAMEVFNGCGMRVPISKIQRLGPYNRNGNRQVLCQFVRYCDIQLILHNRGQLPDNVYVHEDYPEEIENRRRLLRPIFNQARKLPKYKGKCRLTVDRLVIDGKTYTAAPVRNLDKLPEDLNVRKIAEREDDETLAFFTQSSPFSNFHHAPFTKNGVKYLCSEQYIQAEKARLFNDDTSCFRIMKSTNPYVMKREGSNVKNFIEQKWERAAEEIAFQACLAKFQQNGDLKEILLQTRRKELVEASTDPFWGAGLSLNDRNILNRDARSGCNVLGKVLMRVREMLTGTKSLQSTQS